MAHTKTLNYQIRISNADTGKLVEAVNIDWGVKIYHLPITGQLVISVADLDGDTSRAFSIQPEYTYDIGFFEQ